jgi:hypothetical protein
MKKTFIFFILFLVFTFCVAQEKLPIIFLSPDASFEVDCSNTHKNKNQIEQRCKNYIQETKTKYSSVLHPISFRLLEAIVWKNLSVDNCVEQSVADAKIKNIADEIKNIPNEEVLIFLTRFGFEPSFAINENLLHTEEEVNTLLEGTTDEYLLMIKNSIPRMHAEALFLVAKSLAKNEENCQSVCDLIEKAKRFLFDEVIANEASELQTSCKCFENETDNSN